MRFVTVLAVSLLLSGLRAQDAPKDLFDKAVTAQKELRSGQQRPDKTKIDEFQKSVKDTLAANKDAFAKDDGVYYRGRMEMLANDRDAAAASFKTFHATKPDTEIGHEARVIAAQLAGGREAEAKALLADVKPDKLSEPMRKSFEAMQSGFKAEETRNNLNGKEPPAIAATKVLNGPADWTFASSKGKVVVVDFWATWCPPCRQIIPDLVKLQEQHGAEGLQVVGATRYYGYGMEFEADSKLPHGGKSVGDARDPAKKLSEADELKVNEKFVAAFKLNYPVVFTDANVGKDGYGVTGIPTCFVIGRDGKVVGHVVGGGKEAHDKLEAMIKTALGSGAAEAAGKKGD